MERIAIIGANDSINQLILKAKELQFETHVFAWKTGDVGESSADMFYPISIANKDQILEVCKQVDPVAVVSITSDFSSETANYVARGLGLPANNVGSSLITRNKFRMREALRSHGLFTPWFNLIDDPLQYGRPLFPAIVKPTDRWSSKGVCKVNSTSELPGAIRVAIDSSYEKKAIIEGFIEGEEYSCECISHEGEHTILAYTKKFTTGAPHYVETAHIQPAVLTAELRAKVSLDMVRALNALQIENGASHVEFKLMADDTVGIIEVGARMAGDYIGTDLVPLSTGYDYVRMVLDVSLGRKPHVIELGTPKIAIVKFILNSRDIISVNTVVTEFPQYVIRKCVNADVNDNLIVVDSAMRFGYCIVGVAKEDSIALGRILEILELEYYEQEL